MSIRRASNQLRSVSSTHSRLERSPFPLRAAGLPIALALGMFSAPSFADFDLRKVLQGGGLVPPAEVKRGMKVFENMQASADCDRFKRWVSSVPGSSAAGARQDLLPFVEDGLFAGVFGRTYDQLTVADFRDTAQTLRECQRIGLFTPAEQQIVQQVWNQGSHARLSQQLLANRGKRDQATALFAQLDALQPTEADLARIDSIQSQSATVIRSLGANEQSALTQKIQETRVRIGVPVAQQKVSNALASADGAGSLASLAALNDELARSPLGAQQTQTWREQLRARIASLDASVAATERSASPLGDSQPAGLAGLEQSKSWLADFNRRYAGALPNAPALSGLAREVAQKREAMIAAAEPALRQQIRASSSVPATSALLDRYLASNEQGSSAGSALRSAVSERVATLEAEAKNEAVFGPQQRATVASPAPVTQTANSATATRVADPAVSHPSIDKCDALAADPQDPTRTAPGVSDEDLVAAPALAACNAALQQAPKSARMKFQQARALLKAERFNDAVAAFQVAAAAGQPGAMAYLSMAHEHGAGGLPKSQAKADALFEKAQALGYGSGAAPAQASPPAPGRAEPSQRVATSATAPGSAAQPAAAARLKGTYEEASTMQAVYYADASQFDKGALYTGKYLLAQAEIIMGECKTIRLSEFRGFQENVTRKLMPRTQDEMMAQAGNNIMASLQLMAQMQRNPQVLVDAGKAEQRLEDAPTYAADDLVEFTKQYGICGSEPLNRYTGNLRAYFERLNTR
ncbi:hypothetical protein BH09PSE5_BH09PSE5_05090 [soil metagenome]